MPGRDRLFRWLALVACLVLVGFVAYAVVAATEHHPASFPEVASPSRLRTGQRAPKFDLSRLGGGASVGLTDAGSSPTVVNFFASWCANCVAELHSFAIASRSPGDVRFVGIDSTDPDPSSAEHLLRAAGISYPVGIDRSGAVADRYLISALPVTFFIAPSGVIKGEIFGRASTAQLDAWVARLRALSP